jgi:hypothetical protein
MRAAQLAATLGLLAVAAPAWAADVAVDPTPGVSKDDTVLDGRWIQQSDMNLTRRAESLGQWQGDASLQAGTGAPGSLNVSPGVTGRIGLGHGLTAEITASGTSTRPDTYRPGIGLKWQFLGSPASKGSLAVMALYRPEGFNTPEGEVELHVLAGYRSGRTEFAFNAVAGGDPDGRDRDLEAHIGAGYSLTRNLVLGAEGQSRAGLGTKVEGWGRQEHIAGPSLQFRTGNFLFSGLIGGGAFQPTQGADLQVGGYGMARIGYRF